MSVKKRGHQVVSRVGAETTLEVANGTTTSSTRFRLAKFTAIFA